MLQSAYRTLVVDDVPEIRRLTARALSRSGFECETAADGEEALSMFRDSHHDFVVTDLRMPRRHGHSLIVELMNEEIRPRIIVLTAVAEPRLAEDLLERGVDEVLKKPINYDVLAMRMLALVEGKPGQDASDSAELEGILPMTRIELLGRIEASIANLSDCFAEQHVDLFQSIDELPEPPTAVKHLIARFEANDNESVRTESSQGSRKKDRVTIATTGIAVPVDRNGVQRGDAFKLAVRDISASGARLLYTRATNADYLALRWPAETIPLRQLTVLARVMRCRPQSPFYDIGCQFVVAEQ